MPSFPKQYFRAGAGAVVASPLRPGQVLVFERTGIPGAWQFPQGGLEVDEEPERAVWRELKEETGLGPAHVRLLEPFPEPLAYELPVSARRSKTGRGQVLYWFFFELVVSDSELELPRDGEFGSWRWVSLTDAVRDAAPFRKPAYERLRQHFEAHIGERIASRQSHGH